LLGRAGRRPEPPADVRARVLAAAEAEWNARKRRRRWPLLAVAAGVAAMVVAGMLVRIGATTFDVRLAETDALLVDARHYEQGGATLELAPGTAMSAGSAARLVSAAGADVRLRAGTELTWEAADRIALTDGAVYVDTHGRSGFRVETPAGVVEDVGTRFMVTVADDTVEVAMRQGLTRIDTPHGRFTAGVDDGGGDVLRIDPQGAVAREEPLSGARWEWIHEVHPGYRETAVPRLLEEIARDLGMPLEYANADVQAAIANARISGDLGDLGPRDALRVVLAADGLALVDDSDERLLVGFETAAE